MIKATMTAQKRRHGEVEQEGLWACHLPAFQALLAADTQWRAASVGMGGLVFLGLDYTAAKISIDMHGLALTAEQWKDFRSIESAATALRNGAKPESLLSQESLQ